jgi:hypothetical protein
MASQGAAEFEFVSDLTGFRAPGWLIVRLAGRLQRKHDLLRAVATGLNFPHYFGGNWDALEECLRDLSWLDVGEGVIFVHEQVPLADRDQRRTYFEILRNSQTTGRTRLRVVLPASTRTECEI